VTWACGTGPAIFAEVHAIAAFKYFVLEPVHSFVILKKDLLRLAVFSTAACFVSLATPIME
jgi:K+-sensing histidine kinase KdpD